MSIAGQRVEKRKQPRAPFKGWLRILWQDDEGRERISRVDCVDISLHGIRLRSAEKIPHRATITFNSHELGIAGRGTVRSVVPRKAGYEMGVECNSGPAWKTLFSRLVSEIEGRPQPGGVQKG